MRRLLKPLRVLAAGVCFLALNAAFFALLVTNALCLDTLPDFSWAAKLQLVPAVFAADVVVIAAILAVTALAGRVYCSTVCPLGVFQDLVVFVRRRLTKRGFSYDRPTLTSRLVPAAILVVSLGAGYSAFDPYGAYGRFVAHLVRPALQWLVNLGAAWSDAHEKYWLMSDEVAWPSPEALAVSAALLVAIAALVLWKGRWYCNHVCPVGLVLGAVARVAPFRPRIDASACVGCGRCASGCRAGAIDVAAKRIDNSRCVRCFDCAGVCGKGAVKW